MGGSVYDLDVCNTYLLSGNDTAELADEFDAAESDVSLYYVCAYHFDEWGIACTGAVFGLYYLGSGAVCDRAVYI